MEATVHFVEAVDEEAGLDYVAVMDPKAELPGGQERKELGRAMEKVWNVLLKQEERQ